MSIWRGSVLLLVACAACGKKTAPTFSEHFDAYTQVYRACLQEPGRGGADCSEFNSDNGPLTTALLAGIQKAPANKQQLVDALFEQERFDRQEASFSILRRALTRTEMIPLCKRIGNYVDSPMVVVIVNYLLDVDKSQWGTPDYVEGYRVAFDIVSATIHGTKASQNITVTANMVQNFGPMESGQLRIQFFLSLKERLRANKDSAKLIRNMVRQSYNYGFFPKKDILALRLTVEKNFGKVVTSEIFAFTTEYGNLYKP